MLFYFWNEQPSLFWYWKYIAIIIIIIIIIIIVGVVKANEHNVLKEYGRNHELTDDWTQYLSKSMDYVKRNDRSGNVEPSEKFLQKEKIIKSAWNLTSCIRSWYPSWFSF